MLIGNYGVQNLGDEALREYFEAHFPEVHWSVVSANPKKGEFPRLPCGPRSLIGTPWWQTIRAIRHSDGVIFGGGSLFTDVESPFACILWWWHAFVARLCRKPVLLAFQGIGPFRSKIGRMLARNVLRHADFLSVRDFLSVERVKSLNLNTKIVQSFDPVFLLLDNKKSAEVRTKNLFTIIPRKNSTHELTEKAVELVADQDIDEVRILSLQERQSHEQLICHELLAAFSERGIETSITTARSLAELVRHIEDSSLLLSQRYHGALAGIAQGIETIALPQREGDKLATLDGLTEAQVDELRARAQHGEDALREALNKKVQHRADVRNTVQQHLHNISD